MVLPRIAVDCPVCHEPLGPITAATEEDAFWGNCRHRAHVQCMRRWRERSSACPEVSCTEVSGKRDTGNQCAHLCRSIAYALLLTAIVSPIVAGYVGSTMLLYTRIARGELCDDLESLPELPVVLCVRTAEIPREYCKDVSRYFSNRTLFEEENAMDVYEVVSRAYKKDCHHYYNFNNAGPGEQAFADVSFVGYFWPFLVAQAAMCNARVDPTEFMMHQIRMCADVMRSVQSTPEIDVIRRYARHSE